MGTITEDRSTSIYGELGRKADTVPLAHDGERWTPRAAGLSHADGSRIACCRPSSCRWRSIRPSTPRSGRWAWPATRCAARVEFQHGVPPLKLDNTYAGDFNVPLQASTGVASPLAYHLSAGFDALKIKNINLEIEASERKRLLQMDQITASPKQVHPGESVDLTVTFTGENGVEVQKTVHYRVPVGAPARHVELHRLRRRLFERAGLPADWPPNAPEVPTQLVSFLNNLRPNTNAYVRVWRTDPAFQVQGQDLPDPPPSVGLILAKAQAAQGCLVAARLQDR